MTRQREFPKTDIGHGAIFKITIFEFSAGLHVCLCIYFFIIDINAYGSLLSI